MQQQTDLNYYCHVCGCEVQSQINASNSESECAVCHSNFIELLGQGIETFIAGATVPASVSPTNTDQDLNRRREWRRLDITRPSTRATINEVVGPFINPDRESHFHSGNNNGRPISIFTSSAVNMGPNQNASESRAIQSPIELSSLISAFMMGRAVPDNTGSSFLGYAGGTGRTFEDFLHHIFMNENSHAGEPPATERVIESLQRTVVSSSADILKLGECSISQEAFELGDISISLPCKHSYKEAPIIHWLKMHNTCPVCRIPLPSVQANVPAAAVEIVEWLRMTSK